MKDEPDFRALFESAPGLYLVLSPELTILAVSEAYLKATMTRREKILGRHLFEVFPDNPDDPAATGVRNLKASLDRVLARKAPDAMAVQKYDIRRPEPEGGFEERSWNPVNSPVLGPGGEVRYIIHRVEDVTEIVRLNADLKRRVEERDRYFNLSRDLICVASTDGHFKLLNPAWESTLGFSVEELLAKPYLDFVHPEDRGATVSTRGRQEGGEDVLNFENRYRCKDGSYRWLAWTATSVVDGLIYATARDVTDRRRYQEEIQALNADLERRVAERGEELRRTQEQLMHSQKLEAVGRLAGGIAHDFNNQLSVILGFCDMARRKLKPGDPAMEAVGLVRQAGEKASQLTRQLLAFGRKQVLRPELVDLNQVVAQDVEMFRQLLGEDIDLRLLCAQDLRPVLVDRGQVSQVLSNLVVNARDAMVEGGKLTIGTANAALDTDYARTHAGVSPGRYAMLSVTDTGAGMDPSVRERIFEPYFTTKGIGKGSGLGLAIVHGIVTQSGGHIWVYSEPGQGTTFKVYFPWASKAPAPEEPDAPADLPHPPGWAAAKTLLVVEDEPAVRRLVMEVLGMEGYRVLEAKDPAQALSIARELKEPIDLALTDVVMPGMNGAALARELSILHPETRILYMSGYTQDAMVHRGVLDAGVELLEKPLTPDALLERVGRILGKP